MGLTGNTINSRYRVLGKIAEGGTSTVWRARDAAQGEDVAVKILRGDRISRRVEDIIRFRKEATTAARLDHQNIVKTTEIGQHEGQHYIVMELVSGTSLQNELDKGTTFTLDEALLILAGVCNALEYVHALGVVHRDLKPANIMIAGGNEESASRAMVPKLVDFGVAELKELAGAGAEQIVGTFSYMPPEQAGITSNPVDERSDLYSLGIVLYQLLTGELPFGGSDIGTILHQQVAKRPSRPSTIRADIPQALDEIVLKLLHKEQEDRYQSAHGLLHDIERCRQGHGRFRAGESDQKARLTYRTRLVGREKELETLSALVGGARAGQGAVCLIGGEPGIGKTRLVMALKERLWSRYSPAEAFLLEGRCVMQQQSPYACFANPIDQYIARVQQLPPQHRLAEIDRLRETAGQLGAILVELNPNMQALLGDVPALPALEPERANVRFILTIADFLCRLPGPDEVCVLFLDDLQWADEGSLRLLERVCARVADSNLLVLGTYRDNEIDESHGVSRLRLQTVNAGYPLTHVTLGPLATRTTEEMAGALLGYTHGVSRELREYVVEKSQGNPLFIAALLRSLVQQNAIVWHEGMAREDWDRIQRCEVPAGIVDVIMQRMADLPDELEELLRLAAVAGKQFDMALLFGVVEQDEETVVSLLDQAVAMQFLERSSSVRGAMSFVHDRVREAFLRPIPEETRSRYHRAIGQHLAKSRRNDDDRAVYEVAHHFMAGRDEERGLHYALQAGARAKANYANQEAVRYYGYAREILERRGCPLPGYAQVLQDLGDVHRVAGEYGRAMAQYEPCRGLLSGTLEQASLLRKMADTSYQKGEMQASADYVQRGLRLLGRRLPATSVGWLLRLAWESLVQMLHSWFPGSFVRREFRGDQRDMVTMGLLFGQTLINYFTGAGLIKALCTQIMDLNRAECVGPCRDLAQAYVHHGVFFSIIPWKSRARRYLEKGLHLSMAIGDRMAEGFAHVYLGLHYHSTNEMVRCVEHSDRGIAALEQIGEKWEVAVAYYWKGYAHFQSGEFAQARQAFTRVLEVGREARDPRTTAWGMYLSAMLTTVTDGPGDALIAQLTESRQMLEQARDLVHATTALRTLGDVHRRQGRTARAIECFEEAARKVLAGQMFVSWLTDVFAVLAEASVEQITTTPLQGREQSEALRKLAKASRTACVFGRLHKAHYGIACQVRGSYHWLTGRRAKAMAQWEKGERFLREHTRDTFRLARLLHTAAELIIRDNASRHRARAVGWLYEATTLYGRLHAQLDHTNALDLLRTCVGDEPERQPCDGTVVQAEGSTTPAQDATPQYRLAQQQRLSSIVTVTRSISSILDLDSLLDSIIGTAMEVTGAQRGYLLTADEGSGELVVDAARNIEADTLGSRDFQVSRGIINDVFGTGQARLATDAEHEDEYMSYRSVIDYGLRSVLCVPMKLHNEVTGVCYLDNPLARGVFTDDDRQLLDIFITQAAICIDNARSYQTIVQLNADLEQKVAERTRDLDAYAHTVAHDLKNPLAVISNHANTLARHHAVLSGEELEQMTAAIARHSQRLTEIVSSLLTLASTRELEVELKPVDSAGTAAEAMEGLTALTEQRRARIHTPDSLPAVLGHAPWIRVVWANYLSNAIKYGGEPPVVEIGGCRQTDGMVRLWVRDNGPGLSTEDQQRLFEQFARVKETPTGHGLGLSLVQRIVSRLGGEVGVESRPGHGSEFSFTLREAYVEVARTRMSNQ
ncbi:MAG: protein kinase [Chitinivibrionales bacterium]|nr:protein kinase [Chitinivibrionales bacterium]